MVRVAISVEGTTEERFVELVLAAYFQTKNIYLQPVSMGGNVSVDRIKSEVEKLIYNFDYVTTLYDFYGFKKLNEGETKTSLEQRIHNAVKEDVREKLIPYIQMHEYEGLLFSSPDIMASVLQNPALSVWANNILSEFHNDPEQINNSKETAPSKRLEGHTAYRKTTHGPNIAKQIGLDKLREMCAGFNGWLLQLEGLAT